MSLIYFALSLNAGTLSGDVFLNTLLLGVVEFPATFLTFVILRTGIIGQRVALDASFLWKTRTPSPARLRST